MSDLCRDFLHHKCPDCDCRCHADEAAFLDVATYGEKHAIKPVYSRDLLSHLQSGRHRLDLDVAAQVVRTLIELGWRPTVAQLVREGAPPAVPAVAPPPVTSPPPVATVAVQGELL